MRHHFLIICLILSSLVCRAQDIHGYWQGYLHISNQDSLTVGIFVEQGDSLHIELDSPDQYLIGMAASKVSFTDSVLKWKAPSVNASFTGKLSDNGQRIEGTFTQRGQLPLTLERGHERTVINRPQTPLPPYPYSEEEIRIKDKGGKYVLINGTLTMPPQQPKALVILLTGSGWQNRDEELFAHKPFLVIADHLTRQGYAVFRYDDYPHSIFAKSTTYDFADGVTLILDSFARRSDLQTLKTGLLGHSEGSLVAAIVAARDKRISFIINLGGVAQNIPDVMLYQIRAINTADSTMTEAEIDNTVALSRQLYQALYKSKNSDKAFNTLIGIWEKQAAALTPEEQVRYGVTPERKLAVIRQICSPWFYTFFHLSPATYLKKIKCPVLSIGGEKDLQVDAVTNNALFEQYLPKNAHHKFIVEPAANHLLQPCITGSPDEYGLIETTIKPEVLRAIGEWLEDVGD